MCSHAWQRAYIERELADAGNRGGQGGCRALAAAVWKSKILGLRHHCAVAQRHVHLPMHFIVFQHEKKTCFMSLCTVQHSLAIAC